MKQEFKNMIKEQYVSFEVAKLLKEKGFDEGCSFVVNATSKGMMPVTWPTTNSDIKDEKANLIAVPTQQMTMRWLRERHDIKISLYYRMVLGKWQVSLNYPNKCGSGGRILGKYTIYEDAVEIAIKYCLEEIVK